MSAYLESDSMAPLRLVTAADALRASLPDSASIAEQLLFTAVIALMQDVKRLKQKVAYLEGAHQP